MLIIQELPECPVTLPSRILSIIMERHIMRNFKNVRLYHLHKVAVHLRNHRFSRPDRQRVSQVHITARHQADHLQRHQKQTRQIFNAPITRLLWFNLRHLTANQRQGDLFLILLQLHPLLQALQ